MKARGFRFLSALIALSVLLLCMPAALALNETVIDSSREVPAGETMTVPSGTALRLTGDAMLTVNGTLTLEAGAKLILEGSSAKQLAVSETGKLVATGDQIDVKSSWEVSSGTFTDFYVLQYATDTAKLTVSLAQDTAAFPVELYGDITVLGNGHKITGWKTTSRDIYGGLGIDVYGKAVFQNIVFEDFGIDDSGADNSASIINGYSGCDLTVTDCSFARYNCQAIKFLPSGGGDLKVSGCTFDCAPVKEAFNLQKAIVIGPGEKNEVASTAVVSSCVIKNSTYANGTYTAAGIEIFSGNVEITNCTFESCDIAIVAEREYYNSNNEGPDYDINATLTNVTTKNCESSVQLVSNPGTTSKATLTINGGSYSGDVEFAAATGDDEQPKEGAEKTLATNCSFTATSGLFYGKLPENVTIPHNKQKVELKEERETLATEIVPAGGYLLSDLTPPEKEGYTFTGWADAEGNPISANLPLNRNDIYPMWQANTPAERTPSYTIITYVNGRGSISPSGYVFVGEGEKKAFTFTPEEGYEVTEVLVNNEPVEIANGYTFVNVQRSSFLEVTFSKIKVDTAVGLPQTGGGASAHPLCAASAAAILFLAAAFMLRRKTREK